MSVHGRSYIEYWSTGRASLYEWMPIVSGDVQRVEYEDSVYSPARLHVVISNRAMNQKLSSSVDTSSGTYTVEGEATNPTFRRFQPIRLFHSPRAIYTQSISHNGNASNIVFTLSGHGFEIGDKLHLINESTGAMADDVYMVSSVPDSDTFTLYGRSSGATANQYSVAATGFGWDSSGTIILAHDERQYFYPLFFGRIESVDVSYSDQIGKQISIVALDYLAGLRDEIITASLKSAPDDREHFAETSTKKGTEVGQFQAVSYPLKSATPAAYKLSETVKSIISDWSYGREISTDNTYNGSGTIGESKFDSSSFEFASGDDGKFRHYAGRETKVLNAMKNVAMTEKHAAHSDAVGNAGVPVTADIYYVVADSTSYGGGEWVDDGSNRDLVFYETDHGYENGNMVTVTSDTLTSGVDHIDDASWVVSAKTAHYFKIKDTGGNVKQIATANDTARTAKISPGLTGSFGYDFYLDSGVYAANIADFDTSLSVHRPHLNYFLRGSRPPDPESTGLTLQYPTGGDESENVFGWGLVADSGRINTTKMFLLPQFDHGLYADDLYSHVGLATVSSDDEEPTDINDLGHKLELLKVNSISGEDWVSSLPYDTATQRQDVQSRSGVKDQKGKFHWERSDSAAGFEWILVNNNGNNFEYFNLNLEGSGRSIGTWGAIPAGYGGDDTTTTCSGLAGLSVLPEMGRSFLDPPDTPANGDLYTEHLPDIPLHTSDVQGGGVALTAADLLKDVYNVEAEGLLSSEITGGTHDGDTSEITVTKGSHGMETGNLIKITQLDAATSGTYGGLKVNTAPTRVNAESDTTDTGSYYRVQRVSADTFKITTCQTHRTLIIGGLGISSTTGTRHFKYKMVYNIFKHACRIQRVTGNTWSTGTDDAVLRTTETKVDADYALISDVRKKDKPYRGINVNNLIEPSKNNDNTTVEGNAGVHPARIASSRNTEYGSVTVTEGLGWCTVPHNDDTWGTNRYNEDVVGGEVKVKFAYGDYLSETRFLYGDSYDNESTGVRGVVGRTSDPTKILNDFGDDIDNVTEHTSQDVWKSTNCKILSRMVDEKSISKTYQLKYNESASSKNNIRDAALQLLKRAILPSKRTTCKVFGYPVIKLTGAAQPGTLASSLVPMDNPVAYGGRAGMLVEKTIGLDGTPTDLTFPNSVTSARIGGDLLMGGEWDEEDYYRIWIHLRAGNSVRVSNPPAGVVGNHIITRLTYYERMGTTETTIETTGYDEAQLKKHGQLSMLLETIKTAGSNLKPEYVIVEKLSVNPFDVGDI